MAFTRTALLVLLAALMAAVSARAPRERTYAEVAASGSQQHKVAYPTTSAGRIRPVSSQADVERAVNKFCLDLFRAVLAPGAGATGSGNALLAPLGVASLLSALQQGAAPGSVSANQLEALLQLDRDASRRFLPPIVNNAITKRETKSTLEAASKIFANSGFKVKQSYRDIMERDYSAGMESLDFRQPDQVAAAVNNWVSKATHGNIPNIVDIDAITPNTHMILASAMYFKGVWMSMFDPSRTMSKPFSPTPTKTVNVPMMWQVGDFRGGEIAQLGAQWVELIFDGQHFVMYLVLPTTRHGLDEVVRKLGPEHIRHMLSGRAGPHRVTLSVPRFRLSTDVSLSNSLKQMGCASIFGRNASLTGINDGPDPLVVSDVLHKAEMTVDEQGSTASAATAVLVNTLSLVSFAEDMRFYADHPFLAIIVDRTSKVPLFMARVSNPLPGM